MLRKLWTGEPVTHEGRYYPPPSATCRCSRHHASPADRRSGAGGGRTRRSPAPDDLRTGGSPTSSRPTCSSQALEKIAAAAKAAGRAGVEFGTGHLLFTRIDDSYEKALDAAAYLLEPPLRHGLPQASGALRCAGHAQQIAQRIRDFHAAGVRHLIFDLVGPYEERNHQIERIAREVFPLLQDLR